MNIRLQKANSISLPRPYLFLCGILILLASVTSRAAIVGLMVGNETLSPGDIAIRNSLVSMGHTVYAKSGATALASDLISLDLVVVTGSVTAGDINLVRNTVKPVIVHLGSIAAAMNLTGTTSGTHFGTTSGPAQSVMLNSTNLMSLGLTGTVTVSAATNSLGWGVPNNNAVKIAGYVTDPTQIVIYGYPAGATMVGSFVAPGRRVGFMAGEASAAALSSTGESLFRAAVNWALAIQKPTTQTVSLSGELYDAANIPLGLAAPVDRDITVRLYSAKTGGSALYTESFLASNGQAISVSQGLFATRLGTGTTFQSLQDVVGGNSNLFAEFLIGAPGATQELIQPRMPVSAPMLNGTPRVLLGLVNPTLIEPVGTYFRNTSDGSLWIRMQDSWVRISN